MIPRKQNTTIGLLLGAMMAAFPASMAAPAATPKPVAEWTFDQDTGSIVIDSTGNGNTGNLVGGARHAVGTMSPAVQNFDGSVGRALSLDGKDDCVDVPSTIIDTTKSYTVAAWVRFDSTKGYQTIASVDGDTVSGFYLQLRGDSHAFGMSLPDDDSDSRMAVISSSDQPNAGEWYHVAGVFDAAASTMTLYVDGRIQQSIVVAHPWRAMGHFEIGRGKYDSEPSDFVDGRIDDLRVYQSALTADDVAAIAGFTPTTPTIVIDAVHPGPKVSPTFYGLMTEEINHSYDGGLYAELIRNRAFKDDPATPAHWSGVQEGGASGGISTGISLDASQPMNAALTASLRLQVLPGEKVGAANEGYWGIPVWPNTRYRASLYAKVSSGFDGPLTVDIESNDGRTVWASGVIADISTVWKRYTVALTTHACPASIANRFVVSASTPGSVWINLVSLFPPTFNNRPNGNRIDLMRKMAAMRPSFLRLPGGNYLEGNTIDERFDWKNTIGPIQDRSGHQSPWGYRSTDGFGLLEFLEWCEDLHMQPVLAVYAGYSLGGQHIAPGPLLQPYVQDALDEIQYVTGTATTKWGAERARDGHPAPVPLTYIEIGNEDFFDRSHSYDGRFAQFHDAIKAAYPSLQLIATTPVVSRAPDVIDEHFYRSPGAFEGDAHHYDTYKRSGPKVFVGEWASQEGRPTPDLNAALGDAAWMTGMERNSDIVAMESYAPLFINVNGGQWGTNLIGYDALTSYGSPSYWVQVMFGQHHGDTILPVTVPRMLGLYASVTRDSRTHTIYVKVVNANGFAQSAHLRIAGAENIAAHAEAIELTSAHPTDTNTIHDPDYIVPVTLPVSALGPKFGYTFPAYSVTVLIVRRR